MTDTLDGCRTAYQKGRQAFREETPLADLGESASISYEIQGWLDELADTTRQTNNELRNHINQLHEALANLKHGYDQ